MDILWLPLPWVVCLQVPFIEFHSFASTVGVQWLTMITALLDLYSQYSHAVYMTYSVPFSFPHMKIITTVPLQQTPALCKLFLDLFLSYRVSQQCYRPHQHRCHFLLSVLLYNLINVLKQVCPGDTSDSFIVVLKLECPKNYSWIKMSLLLQRSHTVWTVVLLHEHSLGWR